MAITGTGTKDDPYIVHNYDELKEKYTEQNGSTTEWYIKLVNDIDCNDFGDIWEWTAMERGYGNKYIDLDNHTIKNIMIKFGSSLFSDSNGSTHISNGKILNIFGNGAANIFSGVNLENFSTSINGTNVTGTAILNTNMSKCAVYYKANKMMAKFYICNSQLLKNCDFEFDIPDINGQSIFESRGTCLEDCRIRGNIKGHKPQGWLSWYGINNSVIEIDTTESTGSNDVTMNASSGTIINTEVCPNIENLRGLTACTTAQMRDPDYLNSIGFTVAKVGE